MTYPLSKIEGLGPASIVELKKQGIRTTKKFLERAKTAKGRKELSKLTGINEKQLLNCVHVADYMRVPGMGSGRAELIRASGVPTLREFVYRNPAKLTRALVETNETRKLVHNVPSEETIKGLISKAQKLEMKVTY